MSLSDYFERLIQKVESSAIQNDGKDRDGFYLPTRALLLRHLKVMKDLHQKPLAKPMLKASWQFIVEHLPPDWLVLNEPEKSELRNIIS